MFSHLQPKTLSTSSRWLAAGSRVAASLRPAAIMVVGIAATIGFGLVVDRAYPLHSWLAFRLLTIYGWDLFLTAACGGFGRLVLLRVLRLSDLSGLETLALGLPVGLVGFALAMFAGGYLGLYRPFFAIALPTAMTATWFLTEPVKAATWSPEPVRWLPMLATVYGLFCLALMYLELVSPDALNYDATWCHLVVAQDYAREHRIVPFIANWTKNVPHLASVVQTWCFIIPGPWALDHPFRWMLALHTEFTIFLWTLVGVAAAIDWLSARRVQAGWVAFFLFPSIFVYDGNIGGSADHFVALFAAPLLLVAARAARSFEPGECALFGILAAGATMTKLQSVYMVAPIAALLAARWIYLAVRRLRGYQGLSYRPLAVGPAIMLLCFAVIASPQAIENWVWFHDPLYPLLQRTFAASAPTMPGAPEMVDKLFADWHWQPPSNLSQRAYEAARLVLFFSFEPHYSFIGSLPNFGSLFTLLPASLPFIPGARRLWMAFAVGAGALALWGFTYRVDRNLQTFLPILVAVTGATIACAWQLGPLARIGVVPLVALQIVWGADLMFTGNDRLQAGIALIKSGFDGHASRRFQDYRKPFRDLGHAIPENALVVLHDWHVSLGINRRILLDWIGYQGLIDYRDFTTPRALYDRFAALGVTHIIVQPGVRAAASKQEEVVFDTFADLYAPRVQNFGGFALREMPKTPPPIDAAFRVLTVGIANYADGVYPVAQLGTCEEMPPELQHYAAPEKPLPEFEDTAGALETVDASIVGSAASLDQGAREKLGSRFHSVASYGAFTVYARSAQGK